MTEILQIYKCNICGNIVEVVHSGAGELVCCGQPMELLEEKTSGAGQEKHLPVVEKTAKGVKVKVGAVEHVMEEKHYIEWIEVICGETSCRRYLKPREKPEAVFEGIAGKVKVREYCNLHGLWSTEADL